MPSIIRPGLLCIPAPEHKELDGRHYSIAPLLGKFVMYRARDYAERIMEISASDRARSAVARHLVHDKMSRLQRCKLAYDAKNDKRMDALSAHIARRPSHFGTYVLSVGIFDNRTAEPQAPSSMVGYTELSLKTGHKGVTDSYVRHMQPSSVKPSFGEGVLLDPVALADEQELEKWAISYAVKAIKPQDIGVRFSDVLQFETSQEAVDNDSSWLNRYGEFTVMPSNVPSILGEKPVTVQFASLRNIVKTT